MFKFKEISICELLHLYNCDDSIMVRSTQYTDYLNSREVNHPSTRVFLVKQIQPKYLVLLLKQIKSYERLTQQTLSYLSIKAMENEFSIESTNKIHLYN